MEEDRSGLEGPSEEGDRVTVIRTPEGPSQREIEEHMANHIPFRSWCPFCVTGKAVSGPHHPKAEGQGGIPVISIDYAFMGSGQEDEDGSQNPILVVEDDTSKAVMAHMLPRKGADEYAVERLKQDLGLLGYKRIVLKSDQEPAILALKAEVKRTSDIEIVPEMSPVGDSQSNGRAERAVRTMKGQFRTMKEALDSRYKDRIPASHAVLSWMPRHSAASVTRYQVGKDGKTAYERLNERSSKRTWRSSAKQCGSSRQGQEEQQGWQDDGVKEFG